MDWTEYPNFSEAELMCKCGCQRAEMDPEFMSTLQALRTAFKRPMVVSSGYRCPAHNSKVSSTGPNGPHTTGKAVDIAIDRGDAYRLLRLALLHGFTGIGVKQKGAGRFLHLDTLDGDIRSTIWSY